MVVLTTNFPFWEYSLAELTTNFPFWEYSLVELTTSLFSLSKQMSYTFSLESRPFLYFGYHARRERTPYFTIFYNLF